MNNFLDKIGTGKNAVLFLGFLAYIFNIGGIAYLFYDGHYAFAVAAIIVALFSFKKVREWIKFLM